MIEWKTYLIQVGTEIANQTVELFPKFLAAVVMVIVGLLVAKLLQKLVQKLLKLIHLEKYVRDSGSAGFLNSIGVQVNVAHIISLLVFWIVLLSFILPACNVMGLTFFSRVINGLVGYIPNIAVAMLVLLLGVWAANIVSSLVGGMLIRMNSEYTEVVQSLVKVLVLLSAVIIALLQLHVAVQLLSNMLLLFVGALVIGFAAVFVLGTKDVLRHIMVSEYLRKSLPVGTHVKTDSFEGQIVEIGPLTSTIKQQDGSQVAVRNTDLLERQGSH